MTGDIDQGRRGRHVRYLIVGAGPGGLQMGYFLDRDDRDYLILDKADHAGAFFSTYPRHRMLISINKRFNFFEEDDFNARHDWNSLLSHDPELRFPNYSDELFPSADDMVRYLNDFAERHKLDIHHGAEVDRIARRAEGGFEVHTTVDDTYTCDVLLLATGAYRERTPDIEGIELATPYGEHTTDREHYRNKRVGILGQGNSAFETAEHLSGVAAYVHVLGKEPIKWAWNTHFPGHLRAVNNNVLDMFQLKSMHAVLAPRLLRIERDGDVLRTTHEYDYPNGAVPGTLRLNRDYDEIICCTGFSWMPAELFTTEAPETWAKGKFPALTPSWESVNVPDLFVVGGAMQGNDRTSSSGFIHGFRYNVRALSRLLAERYERVPYPATVTEGVDWDRFAEDLYGRLSTSAGLFQLFGNLCDVVTIPPDLSSVTWREELPTRHAAGLDLGDDHVFTITLEFGFHQYADPAITFFGPSDPTDPDSAAFLHPVIRYRGPGGATDEFRFGDSLLGRWDLPHATGGAVMSYHEDFRRWFLRLLGQEVPEGRAPLGDAFRPWTPEEIEAWHRDHPPMVETRRRNPLSTADGVWKPDASGGPPT